MRTNASNMPANPEGPNGEVDGAKFWGGSYKLLLRIGLRDNSAHAARRLSRARRPAPATRLRSPGLLPQPESERVTADHPVAPPHPRFLRVLAEKKLLP